MDFKTIYCIIILFSASFAKDKSKENPTSTPTNSDLDQGIQKFQKDFKPAAPPQPVSNAGQGRSLGKVPPGFQDRTDDKFQQACLKATNGYRKTHHANPLKIDPKLVEFAKSRCQLVVQTPSLANGQNGPEEYGESIYLSSSKDFHDCTKAMEKWYNAGKKYDYKNQGNIPGTGQFTQLIWLSTTEMGCSLCGGNGQKGFTTYIVCNYNPSGNFEGEYQDNVKKA